MTTIRKRSAAVAFIVAAVALVAAACVPPPPPTGGNKQYTWAPRDTWTVRIHTNAVTSHDLIMWAAQDAAKHAGIKVTRGPNTTSTTSQPGEIVVYVGQACGAGTAGCALNRVDLRAQINRSAEITITRDHLRSAHTRGILLHEFGHVFGLDHFDGTFAGERQIMHSGGSHKRTSFAPGDLNGLREQGRKGRERIASRAGDGRIDSVTVNPDGSVRVAGWAGDPDGTVNVPIYVNGVERTKVLAFGSRPDVQRAHPRLSDRTGFVATVASGNGTHRVCVKVPQINWGPGKDLGCRTVTVTNASASAATTVAAPDPDNEPPVAIEANPVYLLVPTAPALAPASAPPAPPTLQHAPSCGCGCVRTPSAQMAARTARRRRS